MSFYYLIINKFEGYLKIIDPRYWANFVTFPMRIIVHILLICSGAKVYNNVVEYPCYV